MGNEFLIRLRSFRFCRVTLFSKLQSKERMPVMSRPMRHAGHKHFLIIWGLVLIFFFPQAKKSTRLKADSDVLDLKYVFVCLLYTWMSSAGRSLFIRHFMFLRVSAPFLCLWGFFFFFLRKVSKALPLCYHRCLDDPSQYYRIIITRLMQSILERTEWLYILTHPTLLHKRKWSSKKFFFFFCTGPIAKHLVSLS